MDNKNTYYEKKANKNQKDINEIVIIEKMVNQKQNNIMKITNEVSRTNIKLVQKSFGRRKRQKRSWIKNKKKVDREVLSILQYWYLKTLMSLL